MSNSDIHTDEIMCMAVDKDKKIAASGQLGNKPWVFVWNAITGKKKYGLHLPNKSKGVSSICFSTPRPNRLACIDCSEQQNLYIFDMKRGALVKTIATDHRGKLDIEWGLKTLEEKTVGKNTVLHVIAVAGLKNMKFITATNHNFSGAKINYGVTDRKYLYDHTCVCFSPDAVAYSGTHLGIVVQWDIGKSKSVIPVDS